jgi:hypothetical protein
MKKTVRGESQGTRKFSRGKMEVVTLGDLVVGKGSFDANRPTTLACMHGSAWKGDGAQLLGALADALDR